MDNIQSLKGTEQDSYLELLKIFTYGTYSDYKSKREEPVIYYYYYCLFLGNLNSLPRLLPAQLIKIKHLTILSLAAKNRVR